MGRQLVLIKYIATAKPVKNGRVELIHYIKEQSISFEYHRLWKYFRDSAGGIIVIMVLPCFYRGLL